MKLVKFLFVLGLTISISGIAFAGGGLFWGPAGPAPQTVEEAHAYFDTAAPLTVVNHTNPDESLVAVGWVIGNSDSEARGEVFTSTLPSGICVDFDPDVTSFNQTMGQAGSYSPDWWRSITITPTKVISLKITAYNSLCNWDGTTPIQ